MRDDVRAYGDIHGLSPENFEKIKDSIPFPQVKYVAGVLHVDHEGGYLMIDDFLEQIAELLPPEGWAVVDYLDHLDQQFTRHSISKGKITTEERPFDSIGTEEMRGL